MGMIGNLMRVSQAEMEEFKEDSSRIEAKLSSADSYQSDWFLDLDKSWEGIQYILTGKGMAEFDLNPGPLERALFSNQIVDEEQDLGYGPAHFLDAHQVKETADRLEILTLDLVKAKVNADEMMEMGIYPEVWKEAELIKFLMDSFQEMKAFYKTAARENQAILFFIS